MGRSGRRTAPTQTNDRTPGAPQREKVELWDTPSLKRALDDAAAQVVLGSGYKEDHFVSNTKIALGVLTCLWAVIAQFYPKKYPENWAVLVTCLVGYLICTAALNLFMMRMEGECFLFAQPQPGTAKLPCKLSSKLPRFQESYTLAILPQQGSSAPSSSQYHFVRKVTGFFDADGYLADDVYKAEVAQLLSQFEAGQKKTQ